jgi:hypothetical protein
MHAPHVRLSAVEPLLNSPAHASTPYSITVSVGLDGRCDDFADTVRRWHLDVHDMLRQARAVHTGSWSTSRPIIVPRASQRSAPAKT